VSNDIQIQHKKLHGFGLSKYLDKSMDNDKSRGGRAFQSVKIKCCNCTWQITMLYALWRMNFGTNWQFYVFLLGKSCSYEVIVAPSAMVLQKALCSACRRTLSIRISTECCKMYSEITQCINGCTSVSWFQQQNIPQRLLQIWKKSVKRILYFRKSQLHTFLSLWSVLRSDGK